MPVSERLITHLTTNKDYLARWENGLSLINTERLAKNMNLLEVAWHFAGISKNIHEPSTTFIEMHELGASAISCLQYTIATGRGMYERGIKHDWQKPFIHKKTHPKELFTTNPYSENTLQRRLKLDYQAVQEYHEKIQKLRSITPPGIEATISTPLHREHRPRRRPTTDYDAHITSLAQGISRKLANYKIATLDENRMNDKIVTYKREHKHQPQLPLDSVRRIRRHPGISHFYNPKEETEEDTEEKATTSVQHHLFHPPTPQ